MSVELEAFMREAEHFLLIGDSSRDRFPSMSYAAYVAAGKAFYCLDLGGRTVSRGPVKDGKVYDATEALPATVGELAIIWVAEEDTAKAVQIAHDQGCTKVWFSFKQDVHAGVARAKELGMEVVEIGRCPAYYLEGIPPACRMHAVLTKLSGTYQRAPQRDPEAKRREVF